MDKKTVLRVFGEAFLRSMVVLMAIVIIGFSKKWRQKALPV